MKPAEFAPNRDYLRRVERGEIVVTVTDKGQKGYVWRAVGGLLQLRRHEEAGLLHKLYTSTWAGYPQAMQDPGVRAKLTDAGRALLASWQ
jgi:hypothetical protein